MTGVELATLQLKRPWTTSASSDVDIYFFLSALWIPTPVLCVSFAFTRHAINIFTLLNLCWTFIFLWQIQKNEKKLSRSWTDMNGNPAWKDDQMSFFEVDLSLSAQTFSLIQCSATCGASAICLQLNIEIKVSSRFYLFEQSSHNKHFQRTTN